MILGAMIFFYSGLMVLRGLYVGNHQAPLFSLLLPSISGAFIGGLMTLAGTVATIENSHSRDLESREAEMLSLKKALVVEISTWFESFERCVGLHLEECRRRESSFHGLSPYDNSFFPVYINNSKR